MSKKSSSIKVASVYYATTVLLMNGLQCLSLDDPHPSLSATSSLLIDEAISKHLDNHRADACIEREREREHPPIPTQTSGFTLFPCRKLACLMLMLILQPMFSVEVHAAVRFESFCYATLSDRQVRFGGNCSTRAGSRG
eukprot:5546476-Amphidinium_carterae.1